MFRIIVLRSLHQLGEEEETEKSPGSSFLYPVVDHRYERTISEMERSPGPGFSSCLDFTTEAEAKRSIREASISVGEEYQVTHLPVCEKSDAASEGDKLSARMGRLVWNASANKLDQDTFEDYIAACGCEFVDRSLELLHEKSYNIKEAKEAFLKEKSKLLSAQWNVEEIGRFEKNIAYIGKDFDSGKVVSGRPVSGVIEFYYGWKNKRKIANFGRSWKEDLGMRHKLQGVGFKRTLKAMGRFWDCGSLLSIGHGGASVSSEIRRRG